jgi:hypothetical protein
MTKAEMIGASKPGILEPLHACLLPYEEIEGLRQAPQGGKHTRLTQDQIETMTVPRLSW